VSLRDIMCKFYIWTLNNNLVKAHTYLNNASSKAYSFEKLMKRQRGHQRSDGAGSLGCTQRHPDDHRVHNDSQLQNLLRHSTQHRSLSKYELKYYLCTGKSFI
jgi:hypothetical protein